MEMERRDHASGPHNRLGNKGGYGLWTFFFDQIS